jgi:hypothetical protein
MKRGRRIAVITLACAGALAIALLLPREPVYKGQTLSWWISLYQQNPDRRDEAQRAIQHIGTNALPTLLDWLRYDPPRWRSHLLNRLQTPGSAPAFLQKPTFKKLVMGAAGFHARDGARAGLYALGAAAHPAAVELVELSASKSGFVSENAIYALLSMRGQKPLILAQGLTNSESTVRLRAAESIGLCFQHLGGLAATIDPDMDFAPAGLLLINALSDPDIHVRRAATNTLRIIGLGKHGTPAPLGPITAPDILRNSVH